MSEREMIGNLLLFSNAKGSAAKMSEAKHVDIELMTRICSGEQGAFDELYQRFAPLVHGILIARLPRHEVDDIVQEVFIAAFQRINKLREPTALGAWIAAIARNHAADFYRNGKPTEELAETFQSRSTPTSEANEALAVIRSLPETYSETLILRLVEGLTGVEIAEQTGLTQDSVRVNLHRGMKLLREKLGVKK